MPSMFQVQFGGGRTLPGANQVHFTFAFWLSHDATLDKVKDKLLGYDAKSHHAAVLKSAMGGNEQTLLLSGTTASKQLVRHWQALY